MDWWMWEAIKQVFLGEILVKYYRCYIKDSVERNVSRISVCVWSV